MHELSHISEHGMIQEMTKKTVLTILVLAILAAGTTAVLARMRKEVVALSVPERTPRSLNQEGNTQVTFTVKIDQRVWKPMLQMQGTSGKWQKIAKLHDNGKNGDQTKGDKNYTTVKTIQGQKVTLRVAAKKGLRKLLVSEPFVVEYHPVPPGFKRYEDPDISLIYPENMTAKELESNPGSKLRTIEFADSSQDKIFMIDVFQLDKDQTIIEYADEGDWTFPEPWREHFEIMTMNGMTVLKSKLPSWQFVRNRKHYEITNGIPGWEEGIHNLNDATFEQILNSITLL